MSNEYACASVGIVQVVLDRIGKVRLPPPTRDGGPKAPVNPLPVRVSTTRQGSIATKTSGAVWEKAVASAGVATTACPEAGICVACQYSGAAQCFNGRVSRCLPTWADSANDTTAVNKTRRSELLRFIGAFAFLGPLSNIISRRILADPILLRPMGTGMSVFLFCPSITQPPPLAHFFSSFSYVCPDRCSFSSQNSSA
jgi:hypothetical protein